MAKLITIPTKGILSYFTRHRTAANLLLVILLALGVAAVPRMRAQFFPDVIVDTVSVGVAWQGAGAQDVDAAIVQILEPALLGVEGVESSSSTSREGQAQITLEFEPDWDMSRAADDVQSAVDAISTLPEGSEDPTVRRGTWRDRVTDVVITGPVDVEQLGRFADEFVNRLFAAGVTRSTIRGIADPRMSVEVSQVALIRHDVSMSEIATAIAQEVDTDPAGDVAGTARVRTGVAKRTAEDLANIVLRSNGDGSKLLVGDVATVTQEGIDRARAYFVGSNPAISIRIDRSDQGDAIGIQEQVQEVADEMVLTLPENVEINLIRTRSEAISGRLQILLDNAAIGLALVVALLFLFLNARTAFWVAMGIPAALLAAIALMYMVGLTINMISLFALIITLGIVVDDAIVVGEHADFRARRLGEDPVAAAENAATRMAMPVFAATLTTIIAFYGLLAIEGRFGDLIRDLPFTVIVVLIASLAECFLILPHHMSHALAHSAKEHWYDMPSRVVNAGFTWVRTTLFRPFMGFVIKARYPMFALMLVALASAVSLFITREVQWRFFNAPERGSVTGNFVMADGATREDTFEMMKEMQRATEELGAELETRIGVNPVDYVIAEVGGNAGRGISGTATKDDDQLGAISIELIDADLRPGYSSFAFVGELQDRVRKHPLAETVAFRGWRSGPGGDALHVELYGADAITLKKASEALQTALSEFPEVSALQDNLAYDKEELVLELTPKGQALGFTVDGLGRVLRNRLNGLEAATYPVGPRSAEVRVELPDDELTADFLNRMLVRSSAGQYVPLADIVTVERSAGFSTVRRENGIQLIAVTGDLSGDDPDRAQKIMAELENDILPKIQSDLRVSYELAGLSAQENNFLKDARTGLILSLLGIYVCLAWVFSSWTRPIVVMAIIPFGLVGTIYGHYIHGVPLSMFTVVGLLGMTGIIINDSIVLVTTIDEYAKDRGLVPAIIEGAADRLRPVLLTTLTTVLGLLPLLFEPSAQAQFLKPTVITLVYGLGFGMILVLLVVPTIMAMQMDWRQRVTSAQRALRSRPEARGVRGAAIGLAVVAAAWFVPTLGWFVTKQEIPWIALLGVETATLPMAFGLFAAGVLVAGFLFAVVSPLAVRRVVRA